MSTTFFVSDTHLQHQKLLTFGSRKFPTIEEHDQTIIDNWNKTVTDEDTVWHLGDVSVGGDLTKETIGRLHTLKGRKNLVLGNHDTPSKIEEYLKIFDKIVGAFEFKGTCVLTHIPVHVSQVEERFKVNIHGHLHDHFVMMKEANRPHCDGVIDPRYVNVSMEQINMQPVAYDVIKDNLRKNGVI